MIDKQALLYAISQAVDVAVEGRAAVVCFECGGVEDLHFHHVVPLSRGGKRTVPLCHVCHGNAHGIKMAASYLTKMGLRRARERGVTLGRPKVYANEVSAKIEELAAQGMSYRRIQDALGVSQGKIWRVLKGKEHRK